MNTVSETNQHWPTMASVWDDLGAPLRPPADVVAVYARETTRWIDAHGEPRILLLGVTPELYQIPRPEGTQFLAVDWTPAMIEQIWPGKKSEVMLADWREMPLPAGSRNVAMCDGGLLLLDYPDGNRRLAEELHRILTPGSIFVCRVYAMPPAKKSFEQVLAELQERQIRGVSELKLLLGMALQSSVEEGVAVPIIRAKLREAWPDWEELAEHCGWRLAEVKTFDAYYESKSIYRYPTIEQVKTIFCADGKFVCRGYDNAPSDLDRNRPIITFERC